MGKAYTLQDGSTTYLQKAMLTLPVRQQQQTKNDEKETKKKTKKNIKMQTHRSLWTATRGASD